MIFQAAALTLVWIDTLLKRENIITTFVSLPLLVFLVLLILLSFIFGLIVVTPCLFFPILQSGALCWQYDSKTEHWRVTDAIGRRGTYLGLIACHSTWIIMLHVYASGSSSLLQEQEVRAVIYADDIDQYADKLALFTTYLISTASMKPSRASYWRPIHKFYWVLDN